MVMLVLIHVVIALTSLIVATIACITPSRRKIRLSYTLVASTLASGTYLVVSTHSPLVSSCETGLIYTAVAVSAIALAQRRLATEHDH
jgi:disulfide bond formation protein DsbB